MVPRGSPRPVRCIPAPGTRPGGRPSGEGDPVVPVPFRDGRPPERGVFLVVPTDPTSSAHRRSRAASGPGTGNRAAAASASSGPGTGPCGRRQPGQRASGQRSGGRRMSSLPDTGRTCGSQRRIRPDRTYDAASISASREGPRAAWSSRRQVEARCVLRRSRPAAGGTPLEGSQGTRVQGAEVLGSRVAVAITRRWVTGHGVLGAVRGTASSGWVPWSRWDQPCARSARQGGGRGEPRARQGDGSPLARASPVAVGKDRAGLLEDRGGRRGQPVG